ncbi:MAG: sugar ABC transporter permease [Cellulomonadaceae bacterium]|nr:sugar ABC transporter permease [Cellulomonadaceae bacterium]
MADVRRAMVPYGYLSPTIVLMLVLMVTPIVMVIVYSLLSNVIIEKSSEFVGLSNFATILTDDVFQIAVRNTLIFTGASVIAHIVLGLGFATLLNSPVLGDRTLAAFRVMLVLPWLFTTAIVAVLWRMLLAPNGAVNFLLTSTGLADQNIEWLASPSTALIAVTFINIWSGYPFYMISLLAGLQGIPRELYEAAIVDGASPVQRFVFVTIPQLRPLLISLGLLDFIWTTQQFPLIWMTTGGGPINATEVLSTYTYKLAFSSYEFSMASASGVVLLVMSMILAAFYARAQRARD